MRWLIILLLLALSVQAAAQNQSKFISGTRTVFGTVGSKGISADRAWVVVRNNCRSNRRVYVEEEQLWLMIDYGDFVVFLCGREVCILQKLILGPIKCDKSLTTVVY